MILKNWSKEWLLTQIKRADEMQPTPRVFISYSRKDNKKFAKDLVSKALHAIKIFDNRSDPLRAIATYIIERKH